MNKVIKVSCIGLGHRGFAYLNEMVSQDHRFEVISVCDKNKVRADMAKETYHLNDDDVFYDEKDFFKERRGDLCIVATQDQDHVGHAIKALELGYDVLCEKPISNKESEVLRLLEAERKYHRHVFVCHVLRHAPAFKKVKDLLDDGVIGDIISIDAIENVYFEHYCHSYVRGNWRNSNETSPMILAKCCHDLDLLTWYSQSECESISSIGDLRFFIYKNKPEGSSNRCKDCKLKDKCQFNAYKSYVDKHFWARWMVTDERPLTDEAIRKALDIGPYGRCVFDCDNNVVDHQMAIMHFKNGINANLRMIGGSAYGGRIMKFYGTHGEIDLDESIGVIKVMPFGEETQEIEISSLVDAISGHGGGDHGLISNLYDVLTCGKNNKYTTSLEVSIESHLMAFAAEKSRLDNGKLIKIEHK